MELDYIEVVCQYADPDAREWVMASLASEGFESFEEESDCLKAYLPSGIFKAQESFYLELLDTHPAIKSWSLGDIEAQNWNEQWESNYPPVRIPKKLYIRAPFHHPLDSEDQCLEIVIEPKMSFGTGHHATTTLIATQMFELDIRGKKVLDMGCGTGILAIIASKLGATSIKAIDNHPWACVNAIENCERNGVGNVVVIEGDATELGHDEYDVILANINRNVLMQDMERYADVMAENATLVLSGFLAEDLEPINVKAKSCRLAFDGFSTDGNWMAAWFRKDTRAS